MNNSASREVLILEHLPQVKIIARRFQKGLPPSISLDDLISAGTVGLIAAVDRYDSNQNVKLKTYAEYKIRGAMLDSLRRLDWAPRQQRKRAKLIETAMAELERRHGRTPDQNEIADELGLSLGEYQDWLWETRTLVIGSFETANESDESCDMLRFVPDSEEPLPSELFERRELQDLLASSIRAMPQIEQTILNLYFYDELSLRAIAQIIGMHESRVSQLKSQGLLRLKAYMRMHWPLTGAIHSAEQSMYAASYPGRF